MVQEAVSPLQQPGGCESQRAEVHSTCGAASASHEALDRAQRLTREARRDIVAARHRHEQAQMAADPQRRSDEKAAAREAYLAALADAGDEAGRAEATAAWARAVDRANRSSTVAKRSLAKAVDDLATTEDARRTCEQVEREVRMQAETEEQDCLAARVRLAACEERALVAAAESAILASDGPTTEATAAPATAAPSPSAPSNQPQGTAEHATLRAVPYGEPLVVEGLISGDRSLLELTAGRVADQTGLASGQAVVQLQEFIDAIVSAASQHGFLVFDSTHRFWAHLSSAEASDVVAALGRLGFMLEPSEGWHAGRVPGSMDLSMALAYAGLDARSIRDLPDSDELADLPRTIDVDAQAFLASYAPDLGLDQVVGGLGHRAEALGALWDEWGQIRPILLTEQRKIVSDAEA